MADKHSIKSEKLTLFALFIILTAHPTVASSIEFPYNGTIVPPECQKCLDKLNSTIVQLKAKVEHYWELKTNYQLNTISNEYDQQNVYEILSQLSNHYSSFQKFIQAQDNEFSINEVNNISFINSPIDFAFSSNYLNQIDQFNNQSKQSSRNFCCAQTDLALLTLIFAKNETFCNKSQFQWCHSYFKAHSNINNCQRYDYFNYTADLCHYTVESIIPILMQSLDKLSDATVRKVNDRISECYEKSLKCYPFDVDYENRIEDEAYGCCGMWKFDECFDKVVREQAQGLDKLQYEIEGPKVREELKRNYCWMRQDLKGCDRCSGVSDGRNSFAIYLSCLIVFCYFNCFFSFLH